MSYDTLNTLVSSAIWRAEQLDELGLETARFAWNEVSAIEERLAQILSAQEAEGRIARRGAVSASLKAKDFLRAQELVARFIAEEGTSRSLRASLRAMLKVDTKALFEQFPSAAKHHKPLNIQMLANQLQKGGPFGLAA